MNDNNWILASTKTPEYLPGSSYSKHVLCFGSEGQFVAFYCEGEWVLAHGEEKPARIMQVIAWQPLPNKPTSIS